MRIEWDEEMVGGVGGREKEGGAWALMIVLFVLRSLRFLIPLFVFLVALQLLLNRNDLFSIAVILSTSKAKVCRLLLYPVTDCCSV